VAVAARVVPVPGGAEASPRDALAAALEANREMAQLAAELRGENARLCEENAELRSGLEQARADLAVLQRMLFGRSSERSRPQPPGDDGPGGHGREPGSGKGVKRGPGRGRDGGITRTCPGLRSSGISRVAGTAARSAGSRSRRWGITCPGSNWTGG
jgi:hypothetical protein